MTDTSQATEQLRNEVLHLRHRVTQLEAQVIQVGQAPGTLPHLEEPFAALFRASPVAVVISALADGRYVDVNEYFARITGYEREEVIGRTALELGVWDNPEDRNRIGRMLLEQPVIRDIELTFRTRQQERRIVIASLALIDYEGYPCVLTMCHDITERRLAAIERERLLHEAQAAIRIRDDFLAIAAHELKTPLTTLQLHIQSLQRVAQKGDNATDMLIERLMSKLDVTNQQLGRLTHLVDELLDVTQIREGQMPLHLEALDLGQIARTIVARFEEQFMQANCRVTLDVAPSQMIEADQSGIDRIITNLLSNAVKYGRGQPIELRVTGDATSVCLIVRDYGIGIAVADHQRIFERFERAVPNNDYGGLGLGLYVVQQLVTALHGAIYVESEPGSGATFIVTFPRHVH
ncbi:MAG TPA: PAS domain-containing sensor histidine kinase [Herpetosiphonaceae bacterium]